MTVHSLLEGAAFFMAAAAKVEEAQRRALEKAAKLIAEESARVLGTHDYGWPPLQPETIARKQTGDSPLLETGALRDSIQWNSDDHEACIGTDDPNGLRQELGTSHIPPRSFLGGACTRKEHEVTHILGHDVFHFIFT